MTKTDWIDLYRRFLVSGYKVKRRGSKQFWWQYTAIPMRAGGWFHNVFDLSNPAQFIYPYIVERE